MLPAEAEAIGLTELKESRSAANTADATGGWVAVSPVEGCLVFVQTTGAITGTLIGSLETAEAANGLNNVAITFEDATAVFGTVSAANNVQKKVANARQNKGYIKYIGTVGTGPVLASVVVLGRPKTTT